MGNKIQRIYIGDHYQVYPVWRYSYDFRNKTVALIEADGWNVFWNRSNVTFNSYGINSNAAEISIGAKIENLATIMQNANKVTISFTGRFSNKCGLRFSLYNTATSSTRSGVTGPWASNSNSQIQTSIYGTNTTSSKSISGDVTITTVLDLVNGTWTTTATNDYSNNGTISSANITNIRNNINGFYVNASWSSGGSSAGGITSINLLIEY